MECCASRKTRVVPVKSLNLSERIKSIGVTIGDLKLSSRAAKPDAGGDEHQTSADGVFGKQLAKLWCVYTDPFSGPELLVPAVPAALWSTLNSRDDADGLGVEGIFRLSADVSEQIALREQIEAVEPGDWHGLVTALEPASSICLAALYKEFLRELPDDLWAPVRPRMTAALHDGSKDDAALVAVARELVPRLAPLASALVVLTARVMAAVQAGASANRMTERAVATVFAPGLVPPESDDPAAFLEWSDMGVTWALALLRAELRDRLSAAEPALAVEPKKKAPRLSVGKAPLPSGLPPQPGGAATDVQEPRRTLDVLKDTISVGHALFTRGDHAGCAWLYARAAQLAAAQLAQDKVDHLVTRALAAALKDAAHCGTEDGGAALGECGHFLRGAIRAWAGF